jgi:hypothetical protein
MSALAQPDMVEPLERMQMKSNLTDDERFALLQEMWRSGNVPRRGRPKKGSSEPRWADFGLTRQLVHEWRRMAEIPEDQFEAYLSGRSQDGKRITRRGILVHFGKINVRTADVFEGTPIGDLAEVLLRGAEAVFSELNKRERYALLYALRFRLRCIASAADLEREE